MIESFRFLTLISIRPDGNQSNLCNAAYEALMEMIRYSPKVNFSFARTLLIREQLLNFSFQGLLCYSSKDYVNNS